MRKLAISLLCVRGVFYSAQNGIHPPIKRYVRCLTFITEKNQERILKIKKVKVSKEREPFSPGVFLYLWFTNLTKCRHLKKEISAVISEYVIN